MGLRREGGFASCDSSPFRLLQMQHMHLAEALARSVPADLGDLRGQPYYPGSFFQLFVAGAPSAVAAGGR